MFELSDDHGYGDPCGFTGAGAGHQIFTRDVPVPVWAGDGCDSITQRDTSMCSTHHQCNANAWTVVKVHEGDGEVQLRGGIGRRAYPSKRCVIIFFSIYIDTNTIS